jgi:hypothetical protein
MQEQRQEKGAQPLIFASGSFHDNFRPRENSGSNRRPEMATVDFIMVSTFFAVGRMKTVAFGLRQALGPPPAPADFAGNRQAVLSFFPLSMHNDIQIDEILAAKLTTATRSPMFGSRPMNCREFHKEFQLWQILKTNFTAFATPSFSPDRGYIGCRASSCSFSSCPCLRQPTL